MHAEDMEIYIDHFFISLFTDFLQTIGILGLETDEITEELTCTPTEVESYETGCNVVISFISFL